MKSRFINNVRRKCIYISRYFISDSPQTQVQIFFEGQVWTLVSLIMFVEGVFISILYIWHYINFMNVYFHLLRFSSPNSSRCCFRNSYYKSKKTVQNCSSVALCLFSIRCFAKTTANRKHTQLISICAKFFRKRKVISEGNKREKKDN